MIIPVFDVKNGLFVCGKSGKRDTYRELSSVYGNAPLDIIFNLKKSGACCVYIADLDKIEGVGDNSSLICEINKVIPVLLDNGANCVEDIVANQNICTYSILASETMTNIVDCYAIFNEISSDNIIISVDVKDNELLIKNDDIKIEDVISLINDVKPAYTILLNISDVGTKKGFKNSFIDYIISETPFTQHIIGGGLTNKSIHDYKKEGIDNFLVGTLLHDGGLLNEYKW